MRLLEGLREATPRMYVDRCDAWKALVEQVETAATKADLRRAEDQVDAVVCAYVALFARRRPEDTTTYGDLGTGYIVTPSLPAGLQPAKRVPASAAPVEEEPGLQPVPEDREPRPGVTLFFDRVGAERSLLDQRRHLLQRPGADPATGQEGQPRQELDGV